MKNIYTPETKTELITELNSYTSTVDDDVIRMKENIKKTLLSSPELLYVLNWNEYESELFNKDGSINWEGEWDQYFGTAIRPYMFFPDVITDTKTYLCYMVHFREEPRYNKNEYYYQVSFVILSHGSDCIDKDTALPRHDLIGSIIREKFNWSNVFGTQCRLVSNNEGITDSNFLTRTMIFEGTSNNPNVITKNGISQTINHEIRR